MACSPGNDPGAIKDSSFDYPKNTAPGQGEVTTPGQEQGQAESSAANKPIGAPQEALSSDGEAVTKRTRRRTKAQTTRNRQMNLNMLVGPQSEMWTKFFTLSFQKSQTPNNMKIWMDLKKKLNNSDFTCIKREDGSVLIDAKTESNAQIIGRLEELCNAKITPSRDAGMNSSRGIVLIPSSEFDNASELEDLIKGQALAQDLPAIDVRIFSKVSRRNGRTNHFAKITFDTRTLPSHMTVGFERMKIEEDLPKPRQCQQCWKFGHRAEVCLNQPCCPICGGADHLLAGCQHRGVKTYAGHCANCDEDGHTTFARTCSIYLKEKEILLLMRRKGISKIAARRLLEEAGLFKGVSYARRAGQQLSLRKKSQHQQQQQRPEPAIATTIPRVSGQQDVPKSGPQGPSYEMRAETSPKTQESHNNNHHQQQPQAPSHNIQVGQCDHQQESPKQPPGNNPTKVDAVERQLQIIFSGVDEPFLSVDAELHSRSSDDGTLTQPPQSNEKPEIKRKTEVAFPDSPTDNPEAKRAAVLIESDSPDHPQDSPLSTSSPRQSNTEKEVSGRSSLLDELATSAPSSSGTGLRLPGGDVGVPRGRQPERRGEPEHDGQHQDESNCGCHRCIRELAITKLEPLTPGNELSATFRACVKKLKIYRFTTLKSHPSGCLCKTHLERLKYKLLKHRELSKGWLRSNTPPKLRDPSDFTS